MTVIGQIKELNGDKYPSLRSIIGKKLENKDEILTYMRRAEVIAAAPGIMKDVLTGLPTREETLLYSDGDYIWKSDVIYYVKEYDMQLPQTFVSHCLEKAVTKTGRTV